MIDTDFSECRYINDNLIFLFYKDFCKDCYIIKRQYQKLSKDGKIFYKYYIYSNIHTTIGEKNAIWNFLNNTGEEFQDELRRLMNRHK